MKDKVFLDSNVIIYGFGNDDRKKTISKSLIRNHPVISTQVVNEVVNVCLRKLRLSSEEVYSVSNLMKSKCKIKLIHLKTIELAISFEKKYGYSYYDCLILASSFENRCNILYSENFQHDQIIMETLQIINPFD